MAERTKEARAYAKANKERKEAARQWTALAFLLAAGERFSFPQVKKAAARVADTDAKAADAGVRLSRRLQGKR
jgi:hypothetical protein